LCLALFLCTLKPTKLNFSPKVLGFPTLIPSRLLSTSTFNQLGQYTNSPGNTGCHYAELANSSSLVVFVTIANMHFAYITLIYENVVLGRGTVQHFI